MVHASLLGLFLELLKKIELFFGSWSGTVIEEEKKKWKKKKKWGLGNILVIS